MFLLQNFQTGYQGYRSNNKFDRYRSLYLVYEGIVKRKKYKYTAVRHVMSHPKLCNKKALEIIRELFSDDHIDLNKRKHLKILQDIHEELLKETELALITLICNLINKSKQRIGNVIII